MQPSNHFNEPNPVVQAIRAKAMADLALIPDYATAINKCERSVWTYVKHGLPVTYIGRTPYVVLSKAAAYWSDRARQHTTPKVGRPRKHAG
jgi:hypothetical protein